MNRINKPQPGEYAPYAIQYIGLLPDDGLVLRHLRDNLRATRDLILSLPEETLLFRYAPGKWSIKEILVHLSDDERIGQRAERPRPSWSSAQKRGPLLSDGTLE
jgi:hypothetical protein